MAGPGPAFNQAEAWQYLIQQCKFGPRVPGTKAHEDCQRYIVDTIKPSVDEVHLQEFTHKWSVTGKTLTMHNIIATQNWKDAKERVVILAHWDSRPTADEDPVPSNRKQPILGADDGASGVAVMMEMAKVLKGQHPGLGIMYFFTDGEDLGPGIDEMLLGTYYFADHLKDPKPDYGILLDMIGNKGVRVPIEPNSYQASPKLVQSFYDFAGAIGFGDTFPNVYGDAIEDDHLPLIAKGIPTMDLIDFNYKPWHTLGDTPDKCSADSLGKIGTVLTAWLTQKPIFELK